MRIRPDSFNFTWLLLEFVKSHHLLSTAERAR